MNVQEVLQKIQSAFPEVSWEVRREKHLSMTRRNLINPAFPVVVTITEDEGIFVDFGKTGTIMELAAQVEEVIALLGKVFRDELVVALAFRSKQSEVAMHMESFDLTEEPEEYEAFLERIATERTGLERLNPFAWHGWIVSSDWTGNRHHHTMRR